MNHLHSFLQTTDLSPVYVYDAAIIDRQIYELKKYLGDLVHLHYAMKANSSLGVLKHIHSHGLGVEIASGGELFLAQQAGWIGEQIIYTGPVKTDRELTEAVQAGVKTIHVESLREAQRLNTICEALAINQDVLVRINADRAVKTTIQLSGKPSPFGVSESDSVEALQTIDAFPNLNLQGIHVYNASGILDAEVLLQNVEHIFSLVQKLEQATGLSLPVIDFGGGFGIDYSSCLNVCHPELDSGSAEKMVDVSKYATGLKKLIQKYKYQDRDLILELGRYVVADSGFYCTRVMDTKDSRGKKFVLVDGGTHQQMRPAFVGEAHPVSVFSRKTEEGRGKNELVTITGCLCTNLDVLAKDVVLPPVEMGDWIIVHKSGAYSYTASMQLFLSHPSPAEVLLKNNRPVLIREAGKYEDFLVNQILGEAEVLLNTG